MISHPDEIEFDGEDIIMKKLLEIEMENKLIILLLCIVNWSLGLNIAMEALRDEN